MEGLTNVTDLYLSFRSDNRGAYLERFLSALQLTRTYRQFCFVFNSRSGHKLSLVMTDGEGKPGTSAKSDDPTIAFKEVAKKLKAELCRQV